MRNTLVSSIKSILSLLHTDRPIAGLFAPRAGQNFRDEQRRRRSQYDRGTRLAEIEESYETPHHDCRNELTAPHHVGSRGRSSGSHNSGYGRTCF